MTMKKKHAPEWLFIISVLLIYPLPQIAIDAYLPSWPAMTAYFHTNKIMLQYSLTLYILALGFAQLIYGPLSDRIGRKKTLNLGFLIFFLSSFACTFSTALPDFLLCRVAQGLGIGCGFSVASAILADRFTGRRLAQITSYSAMVYSLALILSPTLGGYLQHYLGWHASFYFTALYTLVLFLLIHLFIPETSPQNKSLPTIRSVALHYLSLCKKRAFMGSIWCLIFAYGIIVAFDVIGPFYLRNTYHMRPIAFGNLLMLIGLAYFAGAFINSQALKRYSAHTMTSFALGLLITSCLCLLATHYFLSDTLISLVGYTCMATLSAGIIYPNCFADALSDITHKGSSGAFIGSTILIGVSFISFTLSRSGTTHMAYLAYAFTTLAILAIISYRMSRK
jgi:Bcr/CflA subfamily drug resistance transporter